MSVLRFNGTSDYLRGLDVGTLNGAMTVAMLVRRDGGSADTFFQTLDSGPSNALMSVRTVSDKPAMRVESEGANSIWDSTSEWLSSTITYLLVMTRAAGSSTPRLHRKDITTPGSWEHFDGTTAQANPGAADEVRIGTFHYPPTSGDFELFAGDMGLLGWWDGLAMNDSQVEALDTGHHTAAWHNHAVGTPDSLTEMRSATPTDIEGLVTWTNGGPTLTGPDPTGWTFDGDGSGGPPPDMLVMVADEWVAVDSKVRVAGVWV